MYLHWQSVWSDYRDESEGEVANQELFIPGLLPKVPGRFYYLFGKPIETKGKEELLKDKNYANELYLQVKSEVEHIMDYLLKKREEDPYRSVIDRTLYHAIYHPRQEVPSFDPWNKDRQGRFRYLNLYKVPFTENEFCTKHKVICNKSFGASPGSHL